MSFVFWQSVRFGGCALVVAALGGLVSLASACESRAKEPEPLPTPRLSAEHESCGRSADCADGYACLAMECVSTNRSRRGDYHAARARLAERAGELALVVEEYGAMNTAYESAGLPIPLDLACEQGRSLARQFEDPQLAEAAARILHRCVLKLPAGSARARAAYDALAELAVAGFDPAHLQADDVVDLYMTEEPQTVDLSELKVALNPKREYKRKSFEALMEALRGEKARKRLQGCYESEMEGGSEAVSARVDVRYRFFLHPDNQALDRASFEVGLQSGPQCVADTVSKVAEEVAGTPYNEGNWNTDIAVELRL